MTLRIVRLGAPRHSEEGVRVGTVRRPPRGVPKNEYASRDFYDTWLPELAPLTVAWARLPAMTTSCGTPSKLSSIVSPL